VWQAPRPEKAFNKWSKGDRSVESFVLADREWIGDSFRVYLIDNDSTERRRKLRQCPVD
jgi:hypothetical protein